MKKMENVIKLGVPKSIKSGDNRVSIPPHYIRTLDLAVWNNYGRDETKLEVLVQKGAGKRCGYSDEDFIAAGAKIVNYDELLTKSNILLDVKQREPNETFKVDKYILEDRVNFFYAHVEKGQGPDQLRVLLEADGVSCYSPETFWAKDNETGKNTRAINLGFYSGIGGVHNLFEGIKLSYELRGIKPVPFSFFPEVNGASADDITNAYSNISSLERELNYAIIGGKKGLVSSGAQREFERAGIEYDFIYRDLTGDQDKLAEVISNYDGILNATVWNSGDPRIITKRQIQTMKEGVVFVDDTCDEDGSSTKENEGNPVVGGVRFSYETKWGDHNTFYWVGPEAHAFNDENPRHFKPGEHRILYSTIGMIPGGTSTAKAASEAYFRMIFPYLTEIIRSVSQGTQLPENGLVVKDGKIHDNDLRQLVQTRTHLTEFKPYL